MRKRRRALSLACIGIVVLIWSSSRGEEFAIVGPRAMAMGGAGVALTRGGLSTYWNPAALAPPAPPRVESFWDFTLPVVSVNAVATNDAVARIDELADRIDAIDFDALEAALAAGTLTSEQFQQILRVAEQLPRLDEPGTGLLSNASAGLNFRIGRFGFSALGSFHAGGLTNVSFQNLALGDQGIDPIIASVDPTPGGNPLSPAGQSLADELVAQGFVNADQANEIVFQAEQAGVNVADPGFRSFIQEVIAATAQPGVTPAQFFTENQSSVSLRGIILQEYALGYSQPLADLLPGLPLPVSVGAAVKLLHGTTYFRSFTLRDIQDFGDLADELTSSRNREESFGFGVDVGVLAQPLDWISVGLVARNLNQPEFDFVGPGKYRLEPQLRGGLGITPFAGLSLAVDFDLMKNESQALPGYDSQVLGGGAEFSIHDVLFLRGGVSKNLAESAEDPVIHAGLGLRLWTVQLELAAMAGTDFTEISSGDKIPERAGGALMLSVNVPLP
jgi:hypothetical protein